MFFFFCNINEKKLIYESRKVYYKSLNLSVSEANLKDKKIDNNDYEIIG